MKLFPQLIFKIIFIGLFDIIGKIAEKSERRNGGGQLSNVFNFNRVASYDWRMIGLNGFQDCFIKFGSTDSSLPVFVNFKASLNSFKNSRFVRGRYKKYRHVIKWRQSLF